MRRDKARIVYGGRPLLNRVYDAAAELSSDVFLAGDNSHGYRDLLPDVDAIPDVKTPGGPDRRFGPLAGIAAALHHARYDTVVVLACDLPFVDPRVLDYLVSVCQGVDAVIPVIVSDRPEPLHAVYRSSSLGAIMDSIRSGFYRVSSFFPSVRIRRVFPDELRCLDPNLRSFVNVNTWDDVQRTRGDEEYCGAHIARGAPS